MHVIRFLTTFVGVVVMVLIGQGVRSLGLALFAIAVSLMISFLIGWGAARLTWRKRGYVPKI